MTRRKEMSETVEVTLKISRETWETLTDDLPPGVTAEAWVAGLIDDYNYDHWKEENPKAYLASLVENLDPLDLEDGERDREALRDVQ